MKLFRSIILLSGLAFFMPSPPESAENSQLASLAEAQSSLALLSAASSTVADLGSFCSRQETVCVTAQYMAHRIQAKAKYSAKLIYEWANESNDGPQLSALTTTAEKADPLQTSAFKVAELPDVNQSQSTLRLDDIIPEWRGPVLPKNG
jgi:hypothetical protein